MQLFTLQGEEVTDLPSLEDLGQYVASNKFFKKMPYFASSTQPTTGTTEAKLNRSKTLPATTYVCVCVCVSLSLSL
jgi:hypothetical protein